MVRISKVRWKKLDYGWLFDIQNYQDMQEWWDNVRAGKAQKDFQEALDYTKGKAHANVIAQLAEMKGISLVDALTNMNEALGKGMARTLDDQGRLFINDLGGYFGYTSEIEVYETKEIDVWALPGQEPRFIQWPCGDHYYAKIGDEDVVVDGRQKWDTLAEAKDAVEKYLKGKRR